MIGDLRRLGDAELLATVAGVAAGIDAAAVLSHADVAAAGRAVWPWRTICAELDGLLGGGDRLGAD